jgi:hypothetical protein
MTRGNTEVAQLLNKVNPVRRYSEQSATFSKQYVYNELINIWNDCKTPNWDGDNAYPVEPATFRNTHAFIEALPLGSPLPSIGVEPDGHLTLEWYRHPRWTLSISISPTGQIFYAALLGHSDPRGSEIFVDEVPQLILDLIQRVSLQHD